MFFRAVLSVTDRLNLSVLEPSLRSLFGGSPGRCKHAAERLIAAFQHVRRKERQATSGAKLSGPVRSVLGVKRKAPSPLTRKEKSTEATPPPPTKKSKLLSPAEILKSYGMSSVPENPPAVCVLSSQEVWSSQDAPAPVAQEEASSSSTGTAVQFVDVARCVMVRVLTNGDRVTNPLEEGSEGFACARFGDEVVQTEVPKLVLRGPMLKRPAASRPGAGGGNLLVPPLPAANPEGEVGQEDKLDESLEAGAGCAPLAVVPAMVRRYSKLWYKHNESWGIRQKFHAKTQIFSIPARGLREGKEIMGRIADLAIERLEGGESEEATKAWARAEAAKHLGL